MVDSVKQWGVYKKFQGNEVKSNFHQEQACNSNCVMYCLFTPWGYFFLDEKITKKSSCKINAIPLWRDSISLRESRPKAGPATLHYEKFLDAFLLRQGKTKTIYLFNNVKLK
jgi:hypothetical protein